MFIFLHGVHAVDAPVGFSGVENVSLRTYTHGMDVYLIANFTCESTLESGLSHSSTFQNAAHCSIIEFEDVAGIYVKGITFSSTAPGISAAVLNWTTNARFEHNTFTCSQVPALKFSSTSTGLLVLNAHSTVINNASAENCSNGIAVMYSNYTIVTDFTAKQNSKNGLLVNSSLHTTISDLTATQNTFGGVNVELSHNTTIANTYTFQSGKDGIILFLSANIRLESVTVVQSGIFGIYIGWCNFTVITNSTSIHNNQNGIYVGMTSNIIISNSRMNYNNISGITLEDVKNANVSGTLSCNNFNGIILSRAHNVFISHTETNYNSGHSPTRLGSGIWAINCTYLHILDMSIFYSTNYGISIGGSNNTHIINTTVRNSSYSGIMSDLNWYTVINNVTVLESFMDITLLSSVQTYINSAKVTSSESTRGLTMLNSNNTFITNMYFLQTNTTEKPPPLMDISYMFPDSALIVNCTNATFGLNLSSQQRGITIYESLNIIINNSNFTNMRPLNFASDVASLPSVITLYYSVLLLSNSDFTRNEISAIKLFSSNLTLSGSTQFTSNTAQSGTAFIISKDSKVRLSSRSHTSFVDNHAVNTGGVFYISSNLHYYEYSVNIAANFVLSNTVCFLDIESDRSQALLTFVNNTAGYGGDLLYGGQVAYGWDRDWNCLLSFKNISNIESPNGNLSLISSSPSRVCLCNEDGLPDCLQIFNSTSIYPGQTIEIYAVITGQDFGTVAGSVYAQFLKLSPPHQPPYLHSWQYTQGVTQSRCNNLWFTISSNTPEEINEVLILTVNKHKVSSVPTMKRVNQTIDLWRSTFYNKFEPEYTIITKEIYEYPIYINVTLLPCPLGFQLSEANRCDCVQLLQTLPGVECHIQQEMISRSGLVWVGVTHNGTVATSAYCPSDYCRKEKWNTSLSNPNTQCNSNRAGILCGSCEKGLSLTLGNSHCQHCSNTYLALILPFFLAGIALVLFIKLLDLTISQGTINALILYANIIQANKSYFFSNKTTPLTIFIAWINLDVGISTCFFNGLTAYSMTWLQFVFPLYISAIAGTIIIVAKYSDRVAKAMGNNSVPVLATLFLLSYAKLFHVIITALSYRIIYTSQGSRAVWTADGNIDYLGLEHTPLFAVALMTLLFLWLPYTLLLFLGQWLQMCNCRSITNLLTKLKPFLDAHYAPLKGKHRYWFGGLLLMRAIILLISALSPEDNVSIAIYSISLSSMLLTYAGLLVYQNRFVSMFETSFFVNLGLTAQTSLITTRYGGNESICTSILIGIAFIQFLGLIFYKLLKRLNIFEKIKNFVRKKSMSEEDWEKWEQAALLREVGSDSEEGEDAVFSPVVDVRPTYGI